MSIIKTTIATAAVITCCLGNEMPSNQAMRDAIVDNMRRMSKKSSTGWEYKRCLPVLTSVMGNGTKQPSAYRTADDWR